MATRFHQAEVAVAVRSIKEAAVVLHLEAIQAPQTHALLLAHQVVAVAKAEEVQSAQAEEARAVDQWVAAEAPVGEAEDKLLVSIN
jgi:hypothetical protein